MFSIKFLYDSGITKPYDVGIKCNNSNKNMDHEFNNEEFNEATNPFVIHVVIQHVELSWITQNTNHFKLYIDQHRDKYMQTCPWYNKILFSKLSGHNFEDYFKTGRKDRYEIMCAVDAYDSMHP